MRAGALLVAHRRRQDLLDVLPVERHRQSARPQQLAHLLAQGILTGEVQRREQAEPDGLAVTVALVPGDGLQSVADRVSEVESLARARVALVFGDDSELRARAGE